MNLSTVKKIGMETRLEMFAAVGASSLLFDSFGLTAANVPLGTPTARAISATNALTKIARVGHVSLPLPASLAGIYWSETRVALGVSSGQGGFFWNGICGISDAVLETRARMFFGLRGAATAPVDGNIEDVLNVIGVGHDADQTTMRVYMRGSGSGRIEDLGADFPVALNVPYKLEIFSASNRDKTVTVSVTNMDNQKNKIFYEETLLPASTLFLSPLSLWRSSGVAATAVGIDFSHFNLKAQW